MSMPRWCVGVTTVPERRSTYLPLTLRSLEAGGFPSPRLFIDGSHDDYANFPQEKVWRGTPLRTYGNWMLGLWELLIRNPTCDRFAMFQDDAICVTNLRQYLDKLQYPDNSDEAKACGYRAPGYWNLFSLPGNERLARGRKGWYESNQRGWGAVGLVFNRQAVLTLLQSSHTVERPLDPTWGHKKIDGGIVTSFMKAGWLEYVHAPSLVQHIGTVSSMENAQHALPTTFPGEKYDALELVAKV